MSAKRVVYYSNEDMSIPWYFDRIVEVVNEYNPASVDDYDINDILELDNTVRYIDNKLFHVDWSEDYRKEMAEKSKKMRGTIARYFKTISKDDLSTQLAGIDREYVDDFVMNFGRYGLASKVTEAEMEAMLDSSNLHIRSLLESEVIVKQYPNLMKELFLKDLDNIEIMLGIFTHSHNKKKIFIPESIAEAEMQKLCMDYVASEEANANYLDILFKPIKGLEKYMKLSAADKVKIKRRIDELHEQMFDNLGEGNGLRVGIGIYESESAYRTEKKKAAPTDMIGYVDSSWIKDNHDYPSLWNMIRYDEELFTPDLISAMPSYPNQEMGVIESHMGVHTDNSYKIGQYFELKHQYILGKVHMFREILSRHDMTIEGMVDWFFSTYSPEEYGVEWLTLGMPSKDERYSNKTATLFRVEESIRTQFSVLQTTGSIDPDIVNLTNTPTIESLGSCGGDKYVYLSDDTVAQSIVNLLFSSQSSITHVDDARSETSFVRLIHQHDVCLEDFPNYNKPRVQYLVDHGVIEAMEDGTLGPKDVEELYAYKSLYIYGVINYHNSYLKVQKALDNMLKQGRIEMRSTMHSEPESNYLNFILNNRLYDNSWAIRNSYHHGTPTHSENKYIFDYNLVLLVLIICVIKIDDDLRLKKISNGENPAYVELN